MDRTLVRVNTGNLYARWRRRRGQASTREFLRMSGWMLQYTLGIVDAPRVTALALRGLAGIDEDAFRAECLEWYAAMVREHVTQLAREAVESRRRAGYVPVVLSASTPYMVGPLATDLGIEHVLCTRLEVSDGRFTGTYVDPVVYGTGKVTVAERWARAHRVDLRASAFYTDSVSDLPMLERVGEPRIINPDPRLRVHALVRGWPVERWT
jgi:HAD superfamily hydrolase (TIGR01490 family)